MADSSQEVELMSELDHWSPVPYSPKVVEEIVFTTSDDNDEHQEAEAEGRSDHEEADEDRVVESTSVQLELELEEREMVVSPPSPTAIVSRNNTSPFESFMNFVAFPEMTEEFAVPAGNVFRRLPLPFSAHQPFATQS